MHINFLSYLWDPYTHESLKVEIVERVEDFIIEGFLFSNSNRYQIIRGIPRFVRGEESAYVNSFGYQWQKWPFIQFEGNNLGKPLEGHTSKMFEKITSWQKEDLKNKYVADFGCGSGRFIDLISNAEGIAIGVELSAAVESAGARFAMNKNVLICQASVLNSPITAGSMDLAFSIGVLHHTPDPEAGVNEIFNVLRPGGSAAIAVYGKFGYYDQFFVRAYRKLFKLLWPIFRHYPPLVYSYLIVSLTRPFFHFKKLGAFFDPVLSYFPRIQLLDFRWSILDTFDSLTPSYQVGISHFELFQWMKKSGFSKISPENWGGTVLSAEKPQANF